MSSILDSLMVGLPAGINFVKKIPAKISSVKEIIDINRDIFLPVVEKGVTEISVNIFGEE